MSGDRSAIAFEFAKSGVHVGWLRPDMPGSVAARSHSLKNLAALGFGPEAAASQSVRNTPRREDE